MSASLNYKGYPYMPLRLKGVLMRYGITHTEFAGAIHQTNGQPLSVASASLILNRNHFPSKTPVSWVKQQTKDWLLSKGVMEDELADIWETDDGDAFRKAHPIGVHVGQSSGPRAPKVIPSLFEPMEVEMLSPAAKRHFKLFRDPFQDDVNSPEDVFLADDQRYIGEAMFQTAKHGGFLAVVGESGSGKSTLRKVLIERIRDLPIRLIFPQTLDKSKLSTGNICQAIVNDLAPGTTMRSSLEAQARQVRDVLLASARAEQTHTLLIEEAHDISITTLKYLKRFYEIEDGFRKLLSIVLIGQPELKNKLNERFHPEAREVIRRIEIAELSALGQNLEAYLAHKLKRLSVDPAAVLAPDAYDAIRARWAAIDSNTRTPVSNVYPLIVNNTVTKAMNRAAELGAPLVTGELIRRG